MKDDRTEDALGYAAMVERAMRSVVRQALETVARDGLPGDHHFYISFRTDHPDIELPKWLAGRYPEEMTIVLQNRFWGLKVEEEGFQVQLEFNGRLEQLRIPFAALSMFADPFVNFVLQFHAARPPQGDADEQAADKSKGEAEAADAEKPQADPPKAPGDKTGKVVALDAFRNRKP